MNNEKAAMRRPFLALVLLAAILVVGCSPNLETAAQVEATATLTATNTIQPTDTPTLEPDPSSTPTNRPITPTPEMIAEPLVVTETAVPITSTPTPPIGKAGVAIAGEDGKVYLDGVVLLDIWTEAPGCFHDIPAEIAYSPTQAHFLVIPFCIEGDNRMFLFQADGTGKQEVTGSWDYLNGLNYEWSPDGQSFTYERIDSCCLAREDIPADAPPRGIVRYDVVTGEKVLIATPY